MPAGFQCFAQDGSNVAQIDSDIGLGNMQLRQKITQTMAFAGFLVYTISDNSRYSSQGNQTTFTFAATNPFVVFECPGGYCVPMTWTKSGSNWSVVVVGSASVPVTCYVFDQVSAIPLSGNYGLQVFNASGVLVADVTKSFPKIVGSNQATRNMPTDRRATGRIAGRGRRRRARKLTRSRSVSALHACNLRLVPVARLAGRATLAW